MWCLHRNGRLVKPLKYSNGKTQEDVIEEIIKAFKHTDVVFFKGSVGSGKSAIALHVIKAFGSGNIVVPTKILERQYRDDYMTKKFSIPGLKIHMLMGKSNYHCLLLNTYCGDKRCPCSRPLKKGESRVEVASECPMWSPPFSMDVANKVRSVMERKHNTKCKINKYNAINGIYGHVVPPSPCPYYKTFEAYTDTDPHATVFNLAKWEIETWIGRKAIVPIEIIDEGDQFLDELTYKVEMSSGLFDSLENHGLVPEDNLKRVKREYNKLVKVVKYYNSPINAIITDFLWFFVDEMAGISTDGIICEMCNKIKVMLKHSDYSWATIKDKRLSVYIPRPDITFRELKKRCGKLLLMSATFQSTDVLKRYYGIKKPVIIEGETKYPGSLIIKRTGRELTVNKSNWDRPEFRRRYFNLLMHQVSKAKRPCLVQVHAYKYVPPNVNVNKRNEVWWSTTTDRGVDLPDEKCRSIIILKYPYPDISDPVMRTMQKLLGSAFWNYYRDIANRTLIQQVGRGLRHKDDWVELWSPDKQVLDYITKSWSGKIKVELIRKA